MSIRVVVVGFILATVVTLAGPAVSPARAQLFGDPLADPDRDPLGAASQGEPEFAASIGYANISLDDSDLVDAEDALRFEFGASFAPFAKVPQLRLGGALGVGLVFDSGETRAVSGGGTVIATSGNIPLYTLEPEVRVSWRQRFGKSGFFVEPGIGGGAFIAFLDIDEDADDDFFDEDDEPDDSDTALAARAFLNVGVEFAGGAGGVTASYLRASDLDFGTDAGGDAEEFYIGVFGTFRF